jgi:hypothetical protein
MKACLEAKAYWMKKSGWKWRWEELHVLVREEENSSTKIHHQNCVILVCLFSSSCRCPSFCVVGGFFRGIFLCRRPLVRGKDLPGNATLCGFFLLLCLHTISLGLMWDVGRLDKTHGRPMLLSVDSKQVLWVGKKGGSWVCTTSRSELDRSLIFGVLEFKGYYWPCSRTVGTQQTSCVLSTFLKKILLGCWISWTKGFVIDCLTDWESS